MNLESKNILLRPTTFGDLEIFYEWERIPEVTEFFSIKDDQSMEDVVRKFIADDNPAFRQFTMVLNADSEAGRPEDKVIGRIVLGDIEDGWKAEVWRIYIGDLSERGKGYGKEAMEIVMRYCFDELKLERLYLDHYTGNPASHLYLKLGFQYEGVLRKNCRKNGVLYDVHLMSILKDEYEKLYK